MADAKRSGKKYPKEMSCCVFLMRATAFFSTVLLGTSFNSSNLPHKYSKNQRTKEEEYEEENEGIKGMLK